MVTPVSCFYERLAEDCQVNRLEDILNLWKPRDVYLEQKLQSGILVENSMHSYWPGTSQTTSKNVGVSALVATLQSNHVTYP